MHFARNSYIEILNSFYFGGTSVLIVVTVAMDTVTQAQSHMLAHQYSGLIKKRRLGIQDECTLFGAPGAGKGTQAKVLIENLILLKFLLVICLETPLKTNQNWGRKLKR